MNSWNINTKIIQVLLEHGADPNVFCHTDTTRMDGSQETGSALRSLHRESAARDAAAAVWRRPNRLVTHTPSSAIRSHLIEYNDDQKRVALAIIKQLIPLSTSFDIDFFDIAIYEHGIPSSSTVSGTLAALSAG